MKKFFLVIGMGTHAPSTLRTVGQTVSQTLRETVPLVLEQGEALVWFRRMQQAPVRIKPAQPKEQHRRHRRKYAEDNLGEDVSFYFRGPEGEAPVAGAKQEGSIEHV